MANIKKIKLSNGSIYSIFDEGALRLTENNVLITGNEIVDKVILDGDLYITEIDDVPVEQAIDNVLVSVRVNTGTVADPLYADKICKRSTDKLLEDIGGCSYNMNDATSTLSLKFGKQPDGNN